MSQTSLSSADLSDLEAWRALSASNLALQWEHPLRAMGRRWMRWDAVWAADAASKSPFPNSATLLRPITAQEAGDIITQLGAFYAGGSGGPWMLWSAWPTQDLALHGMQLAGYPPLMVRPPGTPLPQSSLRIVEATDSGTLAHFDDMMINGYPINEMRFPTDRLTDERVLGGPMHFYVGYEDERPVTCAASYVGEREVGIYMVATLPAMRGRGYGRAVTSSALAAAPHLPAVLQASGDGLLVYQRLGFAVVGDYTLWYKPRSNAP